MIPRAEEVAPLVQAGEGVVAVLPLAGDGSTRSYARVRTGRGSYVLLVGPDPAENAAFVRIARHLAARGIRVPRVFAVDPARGWILLEDLGDRSLYGAAAAADPLPLYGPVVDLLARMQVRGADGFRVETGFAPGPYDAGVMVDEEGAYFAEEFAAGLLGLPVPAAYRADVERLAAEGARAPGGYFLHRDFQSRNVHLTPDGPAVIDFQGARPGPLAYDVAALVLDPYTALPRPVRDTLLHRYRGRLAGLGVDPARFDAGWFAVGAFRLLQALGAFAKLGGRFGKPGFLEHADAGLAHLVEHLGDRGRADFSAVWDLVVRCRDAWARHPARDRLGAGTP